MDRKCRSVSHVRVCTRNGFTYHLDCLRVDGLGDDAVLVAQILDQLVQGGPLDLLPLQVAERFREVKQHAALTQFVDEQILALGSRRI